MTDSHGGGHGIGRALVLGPGGRPGAAWTAGLAAGLRGAGVDLGAADLTVGTSAGAIVAALLAGGQDLERLVDPARRPAAAPAPATAPAAAAPATPPAAAAPAVPARRPGPAVTGEVFAVLGQGLDPAEARRRVGAIALASADAGAERDLLARREALIGTPAWPDRRLLVTAVDAVDGEPLVLGAGDGVPLLRAVAASSAFPGTEVPVTLPGGRRGMDGALRAGANADLAAGARALVVVEPLAHRHPPTDLTPWPSAVALAPDAGARVVLDSERADWDTWVGAYREGVRQGGEAADRVRAVWGSV
ncbi:patatin-like phospholipase family protein [Kitasatospora sp. NPDC048545]|uniref:patatin-like phospholipase family protein n=1 Tax=Kitasatospora sp. NPDC048545 TaxID=3157208 RepID=UPI0033CA217A